MLKHKPTPEKAPVVVAPPPPPAPTLPPVTVRTAVDLREFRGRPVEATLLRDIRDLLVETNALLREMIQRGAARP